MGWNPSGPAGRILVMNPYRGRDEAASSFSIRVLLPTPRSPHIKMCRFSVMAYTAGTRASAWAPMELAIRASNCSKVRSAW